MSRKNLKIPPVEKISISYFFFVSILVSAQKYKLLTGYVYDYEIPIGNVHVINTSRGNTEVTDINGLFEISVSIGEKLVFSSIQYEKYELIITENIFSSKEITIYLKGFVNELDEVIVTNNSLTGNLKYDLLESGLEERKNFDDFGIPGFKGERKEKIQNATQLLLGLGTSMQIDVEALYKHISGYYKKLKKRRSLDSKFLSIFSIIKFYGLIFFIENYNIDNDQVYDFILGCSENSEIIYYFNQDLHQKVIQELDTYAKIYNNESN